MTSDSELILNSKGNVYHLDLAPSQVAPTCITVGDPQRVAQVSHYFDKIEYKSAHREFITHGGILNGHPIMVISTGISTDNIDIVLNELDALINIDLKNKSIKENIVSLKFIRIGTSGTFDPTVPVDSILVNSHAIGLDSLMRFYPKQVRYPDADWYDALNADLKDLFLNAYLGTADPELFHALAKDEHQGITLTCPGFYGPQGRQLRLETMYSQKVFDLLSNLQYHGYRFTNFEMETAGIYGLANALGHRAVSANIILGNRATGEFSKDASQAVTQGIEIMMSKISTLLDQSR